MKAILDHPGDQADRVLSAWREQELRKEARSGAIDHGRRGLCGGGRRARR